MRAVLLLLAVTVLIFLQGCQTTAPGQAPPTALQTFDALYTNAVTADDLVVKTATTALQSGLINAVQARKVQGVTNAVKIALDSAYAAAQVGNMSTASGNLGNALGPITILSACLMSKPLTVATFDACTAKLTPPTVQP